MTIRAKLLMVMILVNLAIVLAGLVIVPSLDVGRDVEAGVLGRSNRIAMSVVLQRALTTIHHEGDEIRDAVQSGGNPAPAIERLRTAKTILINQLAFLPLRKADAVKDLRRLINQRSTELDVLLAEPPNAERAQQIAHIAGELEERGLRQLSVQQEQDNAQGLAIVSSGLASMHGRLVLALAAVVTALLMVVGLSLLAWRRFIAPLGVLSANLSAVMTGRAPAVPLPETQDEFGDIVRAMRRIQVQAEQIRRIAYLDPGTGLPNRNSLEAELREVRRLRPIDGTHGLILVCINLYGNIRSGFGLRLAEAVMRKAGERLTALDPLPTQVFRMDADILAILVDRGSSEAVTRGDLKRVASEALTRLARPLEVDEQGFLAEPSAGAASYPDDARDPEEYVNVCLEALRLARAGGNGQLRFGERGHTHRLRRHLALAEQIRMGLRDGQFVPYFQPIVDVSRRKVIAVETLVRWRQPDGRVTLPSEFIAVVENSDLIEEMTRTVLARACRTAKTWNERGFDLKLGFNLSPRLLHGDLIDIVRKALTDSGLPPAQLIAEVTETALMSTLDDVALVIDDLRRLGVRVTLDDFGTGYSSLTHLSRFDIGGLKIDPTLMRSAAEQRRAQEIVRSVVELAGRLELSLVVEGIESEDDLRLMQKLGCRQMQGFFFSRALPEEQLLDWLRGYEAGILAA